MAVGVWLAHAAAQDRRPGETRRDPKFDLVAWAWIPAGTFTMGCTPGDTPCDNDEKPVHRVTLTRPFELMTTEVTVAMARAGGIAVRDQPFWSRDNHPVVDITWGDAVAICRVFGGRLPTEAEWEYGARGGLTAIYPWGNEPPVATEKARNGVRMNPSGSTTAVASYAPNGYGLFDMAGNVWEWVADRYDSYNASPQTNPQGPAEGSSRVMRGGSWLSFVEFLRVSGPRMTGRIPDGAGVDIGVRCARDVSP